MCAKICSQICRSTQLLLVHVQVFFFVLCVGSFTNCGDGHGQPFAADSWAVVAFENCVV